MSQTSRIVLVAIPTLLTFVTFITLILAFTGVTGNNEVSQSFWFLRIDTLGIEGLADYYTVGIWNYCTGSFGASTLDPSYCSPTKPVYFFNFPQVLSSSEHGFIQDVSFRSIDSFDDSYDSLKRLSRFNFVAYIISIVYTFLTFPLAIYAFRRRLGATIAIVSSLVAMIFAVGAAVGTTVLYSLMRNYVNNDLSSQGFSAHLGVGAIAVTWVGAGAAIGSFFFWALTACCCAGRVGGIMDRDYGIVHRKSSSVTSWNGFPTQPSHPVAYRPDQMSYYQGPNYSPESRGETAQQESTGGRGSVYGARGDAHMPHYDDDAVAEEQVTVPDTHAQMPYNQHIIPDTITEESEPDSDHYQDQQANRESHHFFEVRMSAPPSERQSDYNGRGSSYYSAGAGASRALRSGTVFNAPTRAPTSTHNRRVPAPLPLPIRTDYGVGAPIPPPKGKPSSTLHPLLRKQSEAE